MEPPFPLRLPHSGSRKRFETLDVKDLEAVDVVRDWDDEGKDVGAALDGETETAQFINRALHSLCPSIPNPWFSFSTV